MQRLIYPLKTISFSQLEYSNFSHKNIPAIDMTGGGTGKDYAYAPCDMKIVAIPKNNNAHTIYFNSLEKVLCSDGIEREVTIAFTHMDDIAKYKVGQVFKSGEICYQEGVAGNATGNHIHIEVANGHHTSKQYVTIDGERYWRFSEKDALKPTEVFFGLESWNETRNLMNVDINWIDKREGDKYDMKLKMFTAKGQQAIRQSITFDKKNKPNGKLLTIIPKGNRECIVTGFVAGIQKDGYQWISVEYRGIKGYAQWDSKYFEVFEY